ncbi:MAG: hypothetical protein ABWY93_01420 [Mycobacterium sp.]
MTTTIDVEHLDVAAPRGRHTWWPWAVLGFAAAAVLVGGVFFTPTSDGSPAPHHTGTSQGTPDHR